MTESSLDADPDYRWGVEAVLRQALLELENGAHVGLMLVRLKRALKAIEETRDARHGEGPSNG